VIAVTSPKRLPALPDIPTMTEAGFAGLALDAWFGLVAPAGTPDGVIAKLNAAFVAAVQDPQVMRQMADQGAEVHATTPEQFAAFIASETERLGKLVRAVGAKAE
jgi:tripartite-type tricarboxylate transporter receptor subunit TctC